MCNLRPTADGRAMAILDVGNWHDLSSLHETIGLIKYR